MSYQIIALLFVLLLEAPLFGQPAIHDSILVHYGLIRIDSLDTLNQKPDWGPITIREVNRKRPLINIDTLRQPTDAVIDSLIENLPYQNTHLTSRIVANPEFAFLIPDKDTTKIKDDTLKLTRSTFSPCKFYSSQELMSDNGIRVEYVCRERVLNGYNAKGKIKWKIDLTEFTESFVTTLRSSGEGEYDVWVKFLDESVYELKSRTGKIRLVKSGP